ncbi:BolA domain UV induced protein Uvi31 [Coemansia sp. IMI 203386]|nr:BolA domain UV induced protein Uvi31 [Coemansia sp. IMI 203386]
MSTTNTGEGPLAKTLRERLTEKYAPTELKIENESYKHRHHAPMKGVDSTETHFKVKIVSEMFTGQPLIKRQRGVYALFKEEMKMDGGIHALVLVTKTPEECMMNPAVQTLLEEIARAKKRAAEKKAYEEQQQNTQYGIIRQDNRLLLRLPPAPPKPSADDCCKTGCTPCILDTYADQLQAHTTTVELLKTQYSKAQQGEEGDEFIHVPTILPGGLLDPLRFQNIAIKRVHDYNDRSRLVVLDATSMDFVLALGEHIQVRVALANGKVTKPFTPVMIADTDGIVHKESLLWLQRDITQMVEDMQGLRYHTVVKGEEENGRNRLDCVRLSQLLDEYNKDELVEAQAVVCGPGSFNDDVGQWLLELGISGIQKL